MRLTDVVRALHPWHRSRLSSIAVWPARERDGGGWVALLNYAVSADPVPPGAQASTDSASKPYRLDVGPIDVRAFLDREVEALQGHGDLGNLALLHLHLPPVAPSTLSRGNGYTAPGWLIVTHAASEQERQEWLRTIHALDDRDPSTA